MPGEIKTVAYMCVISSDFLIKSKYLTGRLI